MSATSPLPLLVVGAGMAGITAALEAAEAGREVVLVEREASVGGRVMRTHHYFPKLCPPSCGMEINTRRLERNPQVRVLTQTSMAKATLTAGGWAVTLAQTPAYVNDRCTACGACSEVCPAHVPDPFNLGMTQVPAIRLPHPNAWPRRFILDRAACPEACRACVEACQYNAIDLAATGREECIEVGAMVVSTGWRPYPLERLPELGGGVFADVIANVQMERLASSSGPTCGKILRPSTGQPPQRVAFIQCAGSRDVKHLPYCSAVCCLASLKQALYVHEQLPTAEVSIYYIDRRTPGRNEDMLTRLAATTGVTLVKGKVGKVERGENGDLVLRVEDVEAGRLKNAHADLVVLATGMVPNLRDDCLPFDLPRDEDGFGLESMEKGVLVAGVARRPEDVAATVRDATGAAAKACVATLRRS
ncbi:MAG: FAD-dependent oxidoreductase [Candidatus Methylomirabilales bacterium]